MEPVKLQDIIDEMEIQLDEHHKYFNTETGKIIAISLRILESLKTQKKTMFFKISGLATGINRCSFRCIDKLGQQ